MSNDPQDSSRRKTLVALTAAAGGIAAAGAAIPFVASLGPSERAKAAGAPVEVHTTDLEPGELHTIEWRGRPVWILRRSEDMLKRLKRALAVAAKAVPGVRKVEDHTMVIPLRVLAGLGSV